MRKDITKLLRREGLAGLLVMGGFQDNPNFKYAAMGAQTKGLFLVRAKGKPAILYPDMERDNLPPIKGLRAVSYSQLKKRDSGKGKKSASKPSSPAKSRKGASATMASKAVISAIMVDKFFQKISFSGTLALTGQIDIGFGVEFARALEKRCKNIKVVATDAASSIILDARSSKDEEEIAIIAEAGKRTEAAIKAAIDHLRGCSIRRGFVHEPKGRKLTIGCLRDIILRELRQRGMECPESPIVAQGVEAAVPHNIGTDSSFVRAGSPIVMDVFPRMTSTGYFFDMTRTVCPGKADKELRKLYNQVLKVQKECIALVSTRVSGGDIHAAAESMFEAWGHPTLSGSPGTVTGFCHGLGHGLGMNVHELPVLAPGHGTDRLAPGSVVTVEPGLYYPDSGIGIRIEDVVAITPSGKVKNLNRLGKRLEIPIYEE